jgi:hypothetical protein
LIKKRSEDFLVKENLLKKRSGVWIKPKCTTDNSHN